MGILMGRIIDGGRWVAPLTLALVLLAAVGSSCAATGKENGPQDAATIELKGLLIPLHKADLSSRSTDIIRMMKEEGEEVHKEDVVAALADDTEKLQVDSTKAVLDVRIYEEKTARELAIKGSDSQQNARTALANLKTADAQNKQAQIALEKKLVRAPFDGVVTKHIQSVGEATDNFRPLLTLVDLSGLYLETYVPSNRLRDVQSGQSVEVSVADLPSQKFKGKVEFIAPTIDPASGEFRVKILVPNEDHALRPGMSAAGLLSVAGHPAETHAGAVTPTPTPEKTRK